MDLGTISTDDVVLASAVLTGFIAYQSRVNGLESSRERERYLNSRLQESTLLSDMWGITIDNIQVHENSGFFYGKKKFLTGTISGESTVVVRYDNATIPGEFWETDGGRAVTDSYHVGVEHLSTNEDSNPAIARFRFQTVDDGDISGFFNALIDLEQEMRPGN
jgi:hypothetical protein